MSKAEKYYSSFRKHYKRCYVSIEKDLNDYIGNFSVIVHKKLNIRDHIYHTVIGLLESKTRILSQRIIDSFTRIMYDMVNELYPRYMKDNHLPIKPNLSLVYDEISNKINVFARRICLAIQSEIETIILTSENPFEKLLDIFPVEQNSGKYHSRLKTMAYMNLLFCLNYLFDVCNRTNGKHSIVVNLNEFKYPYEEQLNESNGLFKFKRHKEMRNIVWERKGQYFVGEVPPSHFGSKEIVLPA